MNSPAPMGFIPATEDLVLGGVGKMIPKSPTLDRLATFLGSYSGTDKLFMVIETTMKILVPLLKWRAQIRHSAGLRKSASSPVADSFSKMAGLISDSRMLWRFFGLVPILKWLSAMERTPQTNRRLLTIERLQALAMLVYYPLEHFYYFGTHKIYKFPVKKLSSLAIWSCRAWAVYVFLHFLHLREDFKLLDQKEDELAKNALLDKKVEAGDLVTADHAATRAEYKALQKKRRALKLDLFVNLVNLPQCVHWSLEGGYFKNEHLVDLFGWLAGVASFTSGWEAT
ncbi:hypothetical protein FRB90_001128 [Tulasnella sp. 427]|nr:hypothetical protein FRB90_001128 [Tulasnella sp. 427]